MVGYAVRSFPHSWGSTEKQGRWGNRNNSIRERSAYPDPRDNWDAYMCISVYVCVSVHEKKREREDHRPAIGQTVSNPSYWRVDACVQQGLYQQPVGQQPWGFACGGSSNWWDWTVTGMIECLSAAAGGIHIAQRCVCISDLTDLYLDQTQREVEWSHWCYVHVGALCVYLWLAQLPVCIWCLWCLFLCAHGEYTLSLTTC